MTHARNSSLASCVKSTSYPPERNPKYFTPLWRLLRENPQSRRFCNTCTVMLLDKFDDTYLSRQDIATIEERLDLVTFFLTMEGVFTSTLKILGEFMDLDRMLGDLVTVPKRVNLTPTLPLTATLTARSI